VAGASAAAAAVSGTVDLAVERQRQGGSYGPRSGKAVGGARAAKRPQVGAVVGE